jgi:hypothetical protein
MGYWTERRINLGTRTARWPQYADRAASSSACASFCSGRIADTMPPRVSAGSEAMCAQSGQISSGERPLPVVRTRRKTVALTPVRRSMAARMRSSRGLEMVTAMGWRCRLMMELTTTVSVKNVGNPTFLGIGGLMTQTIWSVAAYLAVALSLSGNVGVVRKQRWGMGCWIVSNLIWIPHHWLRGDWPSVMMFSVYLGLALLGFVRWKEK